MPTVQCDCTSCVNWQSFPLGVYGYSDCNRRFTPTFLSVGPSEDTHHYASVFQSLRQAGYEPQYVLGDGAGGLTAAVRKVFPDCTRLMCYAHTERRVSKKLSGLPQAMREKLLEDVRTLRFARDDQEFDNSKSHMFI